MALALKDLAMINADMLDGNHASAFASAANEHAAVTISDTNSVDLSLTGQQISAAVKRTAASSIDEQATGLQLVNDSAAPGNDYIYGTNGSGTKGWQQATASVTNGAFVRRDSNGRAQVADPSADADIATKGYVDTLVRGLDPKPSVKAASTADVASMSGTTTIDGVSLGVGDRVLLKNQTSTPLNGIWIIASGSWTRALDMDSWTEVPGAYVFVEQGTVNADKAFLCTSDAGGTLGSSAINWAPFGAATGSGDVVGPATVALDGNIALFDGTTGKLLKDSGTLVSQLVSKLSITAANDFYVGQSAGTPVKKTLAETKTILGIDNIDLQTMTQKTGQTIDTTWRACDPEASGVTLVEGAVYLAFFKVVSGSTSTVEGLFHMVWRNDNSGNPTGSNELLATQVLLAGSADNDIYFRLYNAGIDNGWELQIASNANLGSSCTIDMKFRRLL